MPWNKEIVMSKEEFLIEVLKGTQSFSENCKKFNISRKTGYKWLNRYKIDGASGLIDDSKRPLVSPLRTSDENIELILATRDKFKAWGGRKLRQYLINEGITNIPCERTFNRILKTHEKITPEDSEKSAPWIRFERETPNDLWQMDFKGHFKIDIGRCHPLTIIDDHSRYSICIKACLSENGENVKKILEEAFRCYGLPNGMTMDNGSPWKGSYPFKLSKLTIWLMRLGIKVGHSRPRHPQTQGKLERFHQSLKKEVLHFYQFKDLEDTQSRFDEWREVYNNLRPHEGINLKCPKDRYVVSTRKFPEKLDPIEYLEGDLVRKVGTGGTVNFFGKAYYLGEYLGGEYIGARYVDEGVLDIYFSTTKISRINLKKEKGCCESSK